MLAQVSENVLIRLVKNRIVKTCQTTLVKKAVSENMFDQVSEKAVCENMLHSEKIAKERVGNLFLPSSLYGQMM